jgi:hypothetical protein
MSFIVQISPFVHLFTLKNRFPYGGQKPLNLLGALSGPQTPRRKLCLHFILYLAMPLASLYIIKINQQVITNANVFFNTEET